MKENIEALKTYQKGFKIDELFVESTGGIKTTGKTEPFRFSKSPSHNYPYEYSSFDKRYLSYDFEKELEDGNYLESKIKNGQSNIFLIATNQVACPDFQHIFVSRLLIDTNFFAFQPKDPPFLFPLYICPEAGFRRPNFNPEIIKKIAVNLYLTFTHEKEVMLEGEVCFANSRDLRPEFRLTFAPLDILDYVYAVLHSPIYRKKYNTLLKTDFPRVPYPVEATHFWHLVELGGRLRQLHLLEIPSVMKSQAKYPVEGSNLVSKIRFESYDYKPEVPEKNRASLYPGKLGRIYINEIQHFAEMPSSAWEMYIGCYQPAQKWLQDRIGRELRPDDILHYQKMIVALAGTYRIIMEIDKIEMER